MRNVYFCTAITICLAVLITVPVRAGDIGIAHQMTGAYTNCYLLYDTDSKDAALIDVGGPIDSLLSTIESEDLNLMYFLFTHGHIDHLMGLPAVREQFPEAKVYINRLDYEDMLLQLDWIYDHLDSAEIAEWKADPEVAKFFEFDPQSFGQPDRFIAGDQILKLGDIEVKTISTPGHSRGSICFWVEDVLFSGDFMMYRSAGRTDFQNGDPQQLKESFLKLYALLPDETMVYPGHGQPTDIGSEKRENPVQNGE